MLYLYIYVFMGIIQQFMLSTNDDDINILLLFKFWKIVGPFIIQYIIWGRIGQATSADESNRIRLNSSRDNNKITNEITFCRGKVYLYGPIYWQFIIFNLNLWTNDLWICRVDPRAVFYCFKYTENIRIYSDHRFI